MPDIPGATSSTFAVTSAYVGHQVRAKVRALDPGTGQWSEWVPTAWVTIVDQSAPTVTMTSTPAAPVTGNTVTLKATASGGTGGGAGPYTYTFSQVSGPSVVLSGTGDTRTFTAP